MLDNGATISPTEEELSSGNFRKKKRTQFQLLAFSTDLFKKIKPEDLKDKNGNFFKAPLTAIALPLLELSCGRAHKIGGINYL